MKKGGGSRKGSTFERMISKELSLWWTAGERSDIFWRTHSSGQLGTRGKRSAEYGDIMAIDAVGMPFTNMFSIECRHGACIKISHIAYGTKGKVKNNSANQFVQEGVHNAALSGRKPLWIFREQGRPVMVMMQNEYMPDGAAGVHTIFVKQGLFIMEFGDWKKHFAMKRDDALPGQLDFFKEGTNK